MNIHRPRTTNRSGRVALASLAAAGLLVAACGDDDGDGAAPAASDGATVTIVMRDIRFEPTELTVAKGETVEFEFVNEGAAPHDAFIGDAEAQAEHEAEMSSMTSDGGMDHHSTDDGAVTVDPGGRATLSYTFDEAGTYEIGCHQPGHYAAGMKVTVTVE